MTSRQEQAYILEYIEDFKNLLKGKNLSSVISIKSDKKEIKLNFNELESYINFKNVSLNKNNEIEINIQGFKINEHSLIKLIQDESKNLTNHSKFKNE
jgi:hypothetical protein